VAGLVAFQVFVFGKSEEGWCKLSSIGFALDVEGMDRGQDMRP